MAEEIRLLPDETQALIDWARQISQEAKDSFQAARMNARRLGAHYKDGRAELGFWTPELQEAEIDEEQVFLEVYSALDPVDLQSSQQRVIFGVQRLNLVRDGEYLWGVVDGMQPGNRERLGDFYWVRYVDESGEWQVIPDPLAYSIPYGAFAPAEFYDIQRLQDERGDAEYFRQLDAQPEEDGILRIQPPSNILQVHPTTASDAGSLAGLQRIYERIAEKRRSGQDLSPEEQNYAAYDALQLMPIEPTVEYEGGPPFWEIVEQNPPAGRQTVLLRRPNMTNWGYDVLISAASAVNPVVLESKRPDEFVDLIVSLHNFPERPIKVILDVVFGHADNQALPLLNRYFFAGANMYGQNLNFRHPVVRAILLEMQRRKVDYGVDGVRVDGAQDFKYWDEQTQTLRHDDEYLHLMNEMVQDVAGQRYRPWMVFEDGRPWPREDWELASTYREVIRQMPKVFQWGPLTFAHNTPFLFTFWISKWWRIKEMAEMGSHWITGCANHDTLRRGTQVDPQARVNTYLGDSLPEIFKKAYDNPATHLFHYVCMPGVPMDFINASMQAPWTFIRNTDSRYAIKVVADEAHFLDWAVDEALFHQDENFARLKMLGFSELDELRRFMRSLADSVDMTDYNREAMIVLLRSLIPSLEGPPLSISSLNSFARSWMDDVHELCNVARYGGHLDERHTEFKLKARQFRRVRPWLMQDFGSGDAFGYLEPVNGSVVFYAMRHSPQGDEQVLFVANMEGGLASIIPAELPVNDLSADGWQAALLTPGLDYTDFDTPIRLQDSQGLALTRPV